MRWLAREHWGHGYAAEAARASLREGLELHGLDVIVSPPPPCHRSGERALVAGDGSHRDEAGTRRGFRSPSRPDRLAPPAACPLSHPARGVGWRLTLARRPFSSSSRVRLRAPLRGTLATPPTRLLAHERPLRGRSRPQPEDDDRAWHPWLQGTRPNRQGQPSSHRRRTLRAPKRTQGTRCPMRSRTRFRILPKLVELPSRSHSRSLGGDPNGN